MLPGTPPASSVTVSVAFRSPTAAGVKVRLTVQLVPAWTFNPLAQVVPVDAIVKSAGLVPLIAKAAMVSCEPPGLLSVIEVAALVVATP